jgi:DNA-binding NarL/FixJ family response regulator
MNRVSGRSGGGDESIRVMVVDDHPLVRSAVRQALDVRGIAVVAEAASAEDALLLAPTVRPDVILIDIGLPGMDGIQLVRELHPRLPDACLIMLTVSGADKDVETAMAHGAAGYLMKDIAPAALLQSVRGVLAGELAMGRGMSARLVNRLIAQRGRGAVADDAVAALTEREREVLALLAEGLTDRHIAEALTLSVRTIETHVSNLLHKLHARNRAHAVHLFSEAAQD